MQISRKSLLARVFVPVILLPFLFGDSRGAVLNLELAGDITLLNDGRLAAFLVPESSQGADLNGDGDHNDVVAHVHDLAAGVTTNLGLAAQQMRLDAGILAFTVPEIDQGGTDLNGDGNVDGSVLHVYDSTTGITTNVGLAAFTIETGGGVVAITVSEFLQGLADLNGDGDTDDSVLHVYDAATGATTNLGLDASSGLEIEVDAGLVAFPVFEAAQNQDLNGNGNLGDLVMHVYDVAAAATTNLGLGITNGDDPFDLDSGILAFLVQEEMGADLNGDGDIFDVVLHVYDHAAATMTNLHRSAMAVDAAGGLVLFLVKEAQEGGTDLNGDGDAADDIWHLHDATAHVTANLGAAAPTGQSPRGFGICLEEDGELEAGDVPLPFEVDEALNGGADLNGDGDAFDAVWHVYDRGSGTVSNLTLAGRCAFDVDGPLAALNVDEAGQGTDLNGDLDAQDQVVHLYDSATTAITSVGAVPTHFDLDDGLLAFLAPVTSKLQVYDVATATTTDVGLASGILKANGGFIVFMVIEQSENADLNGDGDLIDTVVHVFTPVGCQAPPGCGDGVISGAEQCDDGNTSVGDGCSECCAVEPGFQCSGQPSVCTPIAVCGDGVIIGAEQCDDGNTTNTDGCSSVCTTETGFQCSGQPSVCTPIAVCGDGVIIGVEQCDDGNSTSADGCSSVCTIEPGFQCTGEPSVCRPALTCPLSHGFWKNHPGAWPVASLQLGSQVYSKSALLVILKSGGPADASLILARQLIAAKLNLANGSNPDPIAATITHADALLSGFAGNLPYGVKPRTATGQAMVSDAGALNDYNQRLLTSDCVP